MVDIERKQMRDDKIARTLIRLKHALRADDELYEYRSAVRQALLNGEVLELEPSLLDLES